LSRRKYEQMEFSLIIQPLICSILHSEGRSDLQRLLLSLAHDFEKAQPHRAFDHQIHLAYLKPSCFECRTAVPSNRKRCSLRQIDNPRKADRKTSSVVCGNVDAAMVTSLIFEILL
jgi:hypothetical protein